MLTRRIIPCLDVDRGKVIRGVKFSADKVVGDVLPMERAGDAYRLLLERKNFGKVVLNI